VLQVGSELAALPTTRYPNLDCDEPESGTITYTYDNNGNVLTKVAPLPNQTGTATVTAAYTYDALNRNTEDYSDGTATPNFYYDAAPSFWAGASRTLWAD